MKRLLSKYKLNSDVQYFEMCIQSYGNGNKEQSAKQIKAMTRENRKKFFIYYMNCYDGNFLSKRCQFFFNLI